MPETEREARRMPPAAYAYALAAVLLWSTSASAFKLTLRRFSPSGLLVCASATAALVLAAIVIARGRWSDVRRTPLRRWLASAVLGLLNPFLYYFVLFNAYARLPGQEALILNYTWAIVLPLLAVPLLRQRLRPLSLLALLISFAGVVVIATRGHPLSLRPRDPLGMSLALGSSVVWATFWIFHLRDERDDSVKLFQSFLCGLVWTIVAWRLTGRPAAPGAEALLGAVYIGLFEMGVTFFLWLRALALARAAARVANLIFLTPFLALVWLRVATGESILASSLGGLLLVVLGIALQRRL